MVQYKEIFSKNEEKRGIFFEGEDESMRV